MDNDNGSIRDSLGQYVSICLLHECVLDIAHVHGNKQVDVFLQGYSYLPHGGSVCYIHSQVFLF